MDKYSFLGRLIETCIPHDSSEVFSETEPQIVSVILIKLNHSNTVALVFTSFPVYSSQALTHVPMISSILVNV